MPDCGGGVRAHRARSSAAPSESRGRVPGLERRGRGGQPRRGLPARGDRRRAVRGHRLRALHRLPADAADRRARRRRRPPARLARDRGLRIREVRPCRRRRHRAEHALAGVLGRHRRPRAALPGRPRHHDGGAPGRHAAHAAGAGLGDGLGRRADGAVRPRAIERTRGRPASSASCTTPALGPGSGRRACGLPRRTTSRRHPTRRPRSRCSSG